MAIPIGIIAAEDRVKPTISITSPTDGAHYSGGLTFSCTTADNDKVAGIQYYYDGSAYGGEVGPGGTQSINTAGIATGWHSMFAVVRDRLGNTQQSNTVSFWANDQHAPSNYIWSPSNGATVTGNLTFACNPSDDVGIQYVQWNIDGQGWTGAYTNGPYYYYGIDTHNLPVGWHTIYCLATDTSGNQVQVSNSFYVNNQPPGGGYILDSFYIHNDAQYSDRWTIDFAPNWFPEGGRFDTEQAYLPGNPDPTYYQMRCRMYWSRGESPRDGAAQHLWVWINRNWTQGGPDLEGINSINNGQGPSYGGYFNVNGGELIHIQRSGDAQDGAYTQNVRCYYDFTRKYAS